MRDIYEDLEELCEVVGSKLTEVNQKIRSSKGNLSSADLDYLDKLTHTLKSIKTTKAMMDSEYGQSEMSYDRSMRGSYDRSYDRGMSGRRDSMGRYAGRSMRSYDTGTISQLRNMMRSIDDPSLQDQMQEIIEKMEHM